MKTLGLDISTVTAGFAISENKELLDCGFFDISKASSYKDKANIIITGLTGKQFDRICIEEAVNAFTMGRTSAQTLIKLIKNKVVISYILSEHYKIEPISAASTTMRKHLFGKAFIKGTPAKVYVKQQIESMFDVSKYVVNNRNGVPDKKMEDVYDAIVCSFYNP